MPETPDADASERLVRKTFESLGYRPTVKRFGGFREYYEALRRAGRRGPDAGAGGWSADYPAPSTFFGSLTCAAAAGPDPSNYGRFCSAPFERTFAGAKAAQSRDPSAAAKLWADLDRTATDEAAWVPGTTPRNVDLISKQVGNFQHHPLFGVLLDQLWVR
jgi:peptide/nickel transport system substrate-binding protein